MIEKDFEGNERDGNKRKIGQKEARRIMRERGKCERNRISKLRMTSRWTSREAAQLRENARLKKKKREAKNFPTSADD